MKHKIKNTVSAFAMIGMISAQPIFAAEIALPTDFDGVQKQIIEFRMDDRNYKVGDEVKKGDTAPYIKNGRTMMPIRNIAEVIGIDSKLIQWDEQNQTVNIYKDDQIIQMKVNSNIVNVDGRKIIMDTIVEMKEDRVMLPIKYLADIFGINTKYNSITKVVTITIEKNNQVEKKESSKQESNEQQNQEKKWDYTYDDLLAKALKFSRTLKQAEMDVDRAKEMKDDASDAIDEIPLSYGVGKAEKPVHDAYLYFKSAEVNRQLADRQINKVKDKIAYEVKSAYYEVLKWEDAKKVATLAIDFYNKDLQQIKAKYDQGMSSELEKKQSERNYQNAKKELELADKGLKKAYEQLNDLIGAKADERYTLKGDIAFEKIKDEDIEGHIIKSIEESPSLWALQKSIELKDLGVKLYVYNVGGESYKVKEIDAQKATIELGEKKQAYEYGLRKIYTSLNQRKDQYEQQKIALEQAQDDLKKAKVNMEIGMTIPLKVQQATLQIEKTKKELRNKVMEYNILAMEYDKLWVRE
ncbi:stalk domain-containing protein [Inediibacterium massiliense]|uniref:stalk domain-containing protein n=1 Tax=Inediibacterium massiliense TaxID=1658111 RepID=UPI0006B64B6B|nr:stalk domain-containing protein [Inediibacterium massiliense]